MRKSQALIFVLFILMIVGILVGALMAMWESQLKSNIYQEASLVSYYLAQAGIEQAKIWAKNNPVAVLPYTYTSPDWGGGRYYRFRVESVHHRPNQRRIIAWGWREEGGKITSQRQLEVKINIMSQRAIRWSWKQD